MSVVMCLLDGFSFSLEKAAVRQGIWMEVYLILWTDVLSLFLTAHHSERFQKERKKRIGGCGLIMRIIGSSRVVVTRSRSFFAKGRMCQRKPSGSLAV